MLPCLCDSGHFTLWEGVRIAEGVQYVSLCVVSLRCYGEFRGHHASWSERRRDNETAGQEATYVWCTHISAGCLSRLERSATSVTLSIEHIGSMHFIEEVAFSLRLGDKVTHWPLHSRDAYLFHKVMMSQSAHQPCIFIDFWPHCQHHTGFNLQCAIMTMSPLKHELSPHCNRPVPLQ